MMELGYYITDKFYFPVSTTVPAFRALSFTTVIGDATVWNKDDAEKVVEQLKAQPDGPKKVVVVDSPIAGYFLVKAVLPLVE